MAMEMDHSFTVPVAPDRAWDVLLDVERIAPCMPGATVEEFDGEVVTGRIKVKVGPVSLTYRGTAKFTERNSDTKNIVLEASGKDKRLQAPAVRLAGEIAPHLFAVLTFVTGIVLLVFTTLPEHATGFKWLGDLLRLAVIEGSHFVGSLVGMGLLLARPKPAPVRKDPPPRNCPRP